MQFFGHETRRMVTRRARVRRASIYQWRGAPPPRRSADLRSRSVCALFISGCIAAALFSVQTSAQQTQPAFARQISTRASARLAEAPKAQRRPDPTLATLPAPRAVLDKYCITCHNERLRTAGLALDSLDVTKASANAEVLEKVIAKLRAGAMPPPGRPRPELATYHAVASSLENEIDRAWAANPNPGRINAVHRLNRTEYNNAIRDLLALNLDVKSLLPGDDTADGSFDNFADVLSISTSHLERYMSVARQVTRLATGLPPTRPGLETFAIPLHVVQDDRQSEDLPFGSRGGIAIRRDFPVGGEYLIKVRLQGSIRTTSWAWAGRSSSTSASMASC